MEVLDKTQSRVLPTKKEILREYGTISQVANQHCRAGELGINKACLVWRRCTECGDIRQVQFQLFLARPRALCLGCSKKGRRNPSYGKAAYNAGVPASPERISRAVAARKARGSYRTKEHVKRLFSQKFKGAGNPNFGRRWSSSKRRAWANRVSSMFEEGRYDRYKKGQSRPEKEFRNLLEGNLVPFKKSFALSGKVFDFAILSERILVEVDGIYWHARGLSVPEMNTTQAKTHHNDLEKNVIAKQNGFKLLRIWEDELEQGLQQLRSILEEGSDQHKNS
jgi:very-short-patch-repair endonuclease